MGFIIVYYLPWNPLSLCTFHGTSPSIDFRSEYSHFKRSVPLFPWQTQVVKSVHHTSYVCCHKPQRLLELLLEHVYLYCTCITQISFYLLSFMSKSSFLYVPGPYISKIFFHVKPLPSIWLILLLLIISFTWIIGMKVMQGGHSSFIALLSMVPQSSWCNKQLNITCAELWTTYCFFFIILGQLNYSSLLGQSVHKKTFNNYCRYVVAPVCSALYWSWEKGWKRHQHETFESLYLA